MDRVKTLTGIPIGDLQSYLGSCDQEFETSQLYSSARDEKFTDEDLRKSVFRTITDDKLFELVESVVSNHLDQGDDGYTYTLRRNDITHIKYEKGGHFKRHRDFLATTSNLIEEYTLLLCVTPADLAKGIVGGDTTIHSFGGSKTFDTTTPGSGILFRKDFEHEGMELKSGEKHIVTANIWATRKETSTQVLLVTFPTEVNGEKKAAAKTSVEEAADESASYVLPVDILSGMLLAHVQWANRAAEQEGKDEPPVVTYECSDYDFDTFGIVEKILTRSYVDEDTICKAKEALDYFGPFKREDLLVSLALEKSEAEEGDRAAKKARTSGVEAAAAKISSFDENLIVCETEARMRAVAATALALGETSYVPFKLLFVEGVLQSRMEATLGVVEIPMMAAACLVGDHDNVFCLRKICRLESIRHNSFEEIHTQSNLFELFPAKVCDAAQPGDEIDLFDSKYKLEWEDRYKVQNRVKENGYGLGLRVGLKAPDGGDVKSTVVSSCVHNVYDMVESNAKTIYLPGLESQEGKCDDNGSSLFHRDADGKVTFTEKEAERASEYLASFDLEGRAKSSLQKKRFVLPQAMANVDSAFCNEQVYGTVNILWVCGLIRMDSSEDKGDDTTASSEEFDAWPSEEARERMNAKRTQFERSAQGGMDFW